MLDVAIPDTLPVVPLRRIVKVFQVSSCALVCFFLILILRFFFVFFLPLLELRRSFYSSPVFVRLLRWSIVQLPKKRRKSNVSLFFRPLFFSAAALNLITRCRFPQSEK